MSKLRPNDWGYENVTERYLYSDQINATPEDVWDRISGARGLWAMYCNAPVFVQLADYAAEHGSERGMPEELLESIRTDAFHTRICVLMALAQHVFSRSSVAPKVNAHRATIDLQHFTAQNDIRLPGTLGAFCSHAFSTQCNRTHPPEMLFPWLARKTSILATCISRHTV